MNPLAEMCACYRETLCKLHERWISPYLTLNGMSAVMVGAFHFIFIVSFLALCICPAIYVGWFYIHTPAANPELPQELIAQNYWAVPLTIFLGVCGFCGLGVLFEIVDQYGDVSRDRKWRNG